MHDEPPSTNILRFVAVYSPAAHLIMSEDEAVSRKFLKIMKNEMKTIR